MLIAPPRQCPLNAGAPLPSKWTHIKTTVQWWHLYLQAVQSQPDSHGRNLWPGKLKAASTTQHGNKRWEKKVLPPVSFWGFPTTKLLSGLQRPARRFDVATQERTCGLGSGKGEVGLPRGRTGPSTTNLGGCRDTKTTVASPGRPYAQGHLNPVEMEKQTKPDETMILPPGPSLKREEQGPGPLEHL